MDAVRLLLDHDIPLDDEDSVRRRISLTCPANMFCVGGTPGMGCRAGSYRLCHSPGWVAGGIAVQGLFSDMSVLCLLAFSLHAVTGKSAGRTCEVFFVAWGCLAASGHGVGAYGKEDSQQVLSSPITSRVTGTTD